MSTELIKLLSPVLFFPLWLRFSLRVKSPKLIGAGLFFISYVCCSSNFSFIYRELHQFIQIVLILFYIVHVLYFHRLFRINIILGIFSLFIAISLVNAPIDEDAKDQSINYIVLVLVANFLFLSIQSKNSFDLLMRFLADISLLLALLGCIEFVISGERIEVTFSNPNYFGLFLGVGTCLGCVYWNGWFKACGIFVLLVALALTGSRSSMAFPIFFYLWFIYRQGKIQKAIPLAIIGVIVILTFKNLELTRFSDSEATSSSDAERYIFGQIAMRMANDHPFTGVGWGRFISEFGGYSSNVEALEVINGVIDVSSQERRVTHNDFFRILAELGWIAFLVSIIFSLYGLWLCILKKGFGYDFIPPVWIGMVFFSVGHNNMNSVLFWFFLILPFFIKNNLRKF